MVGFPALALAVLMAIQGPGPSVTGALGGAATICTPPSGITSLWSAHNSGITCYPGGIGCTNTANIFSVPDAGSGGDTLAPVAQATSPAYTTSAIGTNPAWTFTSANQDALITSSGVFPSGTIMMYAVLQPPVSGTGPIFTSDNPLSSAQLNSIAWYMFNGEAVLDASFVANVFVDTTNYGGVWSEIYFTNNFTTGAYTFGHCGAVSGCVQVGSGTSVQAWSNPSNSIGSWPASPAFYQGPMAEVGYNTTGSLTGLATYLACQYPTIP